MPATPPDWLSGLRCPYTGSRFSLKDTPLSKDQGLANAVIVSEAGDFPVIAGVVRLLQDELREPLVDLVAQGRTETALKTALEVPFLNPRGTTLNGLWRRAARKWKLSAAAYSVGPQKGRWYRLLKRADLTFAELAAQAKAEAWSSWQTYRFSMPTFLGVHAFAHLAAGCRRILDFGCGVGHSSFLMQRFAPEAGIVCADRSFTSLYLARRYLVPKAFAVCLDGNYALPFRAASFDLVFSTDALQYVQSKRNLIDQFRHVLEPQGTIALAHLHNRLSAQPGVAGRALSAQGYDWLFEGMPHRVYAEDQVVGDYVVDAALRLDCGSDPVELDRQGSCLSLVAANDDSVFRAHSRISDAHLAAMRHPHLNPVYRAARSDGAWTLQRSVAEAYVVNPNLRPQDVLPRTWRIESESVDTRGLLALREKNRVHFDETVRRFVILDMPESYV
jgi:SAM-dependent methyltransferase